MICIYCVLEARLKGEPYTPTDEKGSDHLARCHPDPVATQARRKELQQLLDERIGESDYWQDMTEGFQYASEGLQQAIAAARIARAEHGDLRESIARLEALILEQGQQLRAQRDEIRALRDRLASTTTA
jgi:hypothetical protein